MRPSAPEVDGSPGVQFGEWMAFLKLYQPMHEWFRDLSDEPAREAAGFMRAVTHQLLAGGEYLLDEQLGLRERVQVMANVQFLRDTLILEFSEVTEEQSNKALGDMFDLEPASAL